PFRQDTNSLYLTGSLELHGIPVGAKTIVGDDLSDIVRAFRVAHERSDVIVCTGGLGPTVDDLTREGLAEFSGAPLELHQDLLDAVHARFAKRKMKMPEA